MMLGMLAVNIFAMEKDSSDKKNTLLRTSRVTPLIRGNSFDLQDQWASRGFRKRSESTDSTNSTDSLTEKGLCLKSNGFDLQNDCSVGSGVYFDSDDELIALTSAISRSVSIDPLALCSSSGRTDSAESHFARRSDTPFMRNGLTSFLSRFKSPVAGTLEKKKESPESSTFSKKRSASNGDLDSPTKEEDPKIFRSRSFAGELMLGITERSGGVDSSFREKFAKNKEIHEYSSDCESSNIDDENFSGKGKRKRR